jgi:4-aminobutyrate aminotransferase-like enzyme
VRLNIFAILFVISKNKIMNVKKLMGLLKAKKYVYVSYKNSGVEAKEEALLLLFKANNTNETNKVAFNRFGKRYYEIGYYVVSEIFTYNGRTYFRFSTMENSLGSKYELSYNYKIWFQLPKIISETGYTKETFPKKWALYNENVVHDKIEISKLFEMYKIITKSYEYIYVPKLVYEKALELSGKLRNTDYMYCTTVTKN